MSLEGQEFPILTIQEERAAEAPRLYRPHTAAKPAPFDWDAITPTCRSCATKTGQVNALNGLCPTCDPTHAVEQAATVESTVTRRPTTARPQRADRIRNPLDVDAIIEAYTGGQSVNSIRDALNSSARRIRAVLAEAGVEIRNDDHRRGRPRTSSPTRPATTPRSTLDEQGIVAAYLDGASAPMIAAEHGTGAPTIRRILDRHGIERRDDRATRSGGKRLVRDAALIARIRELYVDQQLTQSQVANIIGCSEKVIWRIVRDTPDLTPHSTAPPRKLRPEVHADIIARYLAGQTGREIARDYDCTPPTVYAVLDKHGIARRPRGNFSKDAA